MKRALLRTYVRLMELAGVLAGLAIIASCTTLGAASSNALVSFVISLIVAAIFVGAIFLITTMSDDVSTIRTRIETVQIDSSSGNATPPTVRGQSILRPAIGALVLIGLGWGFWATKSAVTAQRAARTAAETSLRESRATIEELRRRDDRAKAIIMKRDCVAFERSPDQVAGLLKCLLRERYTDRVSIPDDARMETDLRLSTDDLLELTALIQEKFDVPLATDPETEKYRDATIAEASAFVARKLRASR
jgi:hypothetical protein